MPRLRGLRSAQYHPRQERVMQNGVLRRAQAGALGALTLGLWPGLLPGSAWAQKQVKPTLKVLCGTSIRPAMEEIATEFQRSDDCRVSVNYAGSGTLFGSLQAGAEADVFVPGDTWYIREAGKKGMVASHEVVAWFVPVIAVQKGNPKRIKALVDLAKEGIEVGLGKPDACAVGNVTRDLLAAHGLVGKVRAAYEALTVNRLANQIKLKALDAAVIWDATARQYPADVDIVEIDDANFHAVPLGAAVLKGARVSRLARSFVEFAAGGDGARAFRAQHYQVPGKELRVGCGSSMRLVLEDLAAVFQAETGRKVLCNYGGSGTVLLQIEGSREGDVYVCHDPFAYVCEQKKLSERWHTMAYMEPTLAVAKGNPKTVRGLRDLLRADLQVGLPHREYSTRGKMLWATLGKGGMADAMRGRRFFESRTHDLVNQLKLNTVDIAVLWDAPVKAMPEFEAVPIEEQFKVDAVTSATSGRTYSMGRVKVTAVRLSISKEPLLAAQFAKLCLSDAGREVLRRHSFAVPSGNE